MAGCGPSGPTKYPVQGEVRFNGKPLPNGTMTLIPESPQARTTVAQIVDGKYAMEVTAGDWTVNIQAVRETGPVNPTARRSAARAVHPRQVQRRFAAPDHRAIGTKRIQLRPRGVKARAAKHVCWCNC